MSTGACTTGAVRTLVAHQDRIAKRNPLGHAPLKGPYGISDPPRKWLLSRTDLRELGLERRAVDAVFRALPVVVFKGYSRPLVTVHDYLELVERSTYRGDRGT